MINKFIYILLFSIGLSFSGLSGAAGQSIAFQPREKIFVTSDRDHYIAGERLFFHLRQFNRDDYEGSQSGYAYLALRNQGGVIDGLTLQLRENQASGSLYLHDTLSTGLYEVLAFTNWMRNHGEPAFFRKTIFIANRFDEDLTFIEPVIVSDEDLALHFSPEGGYLVNEQPTKLLVSATGKFDASNRNIFLLDETRDTIYNGRLNEHGFTTMELVPDSAKTLTLFVDGSNKRFAFPEVAAEGITLGLYEEDGHLYAKILFNKHLSDQGYLRIRHGGNILIHQVFSYAESGVRVPIQSNDLPHGVLSIEAGTRQNQYTAQRYWYHNPAGDPAVSIGGESTYGKRERVILDLTPNIPDNSRATISVSVRQSQSVHNHPLHIDAYFRNIRCAEDLDIDVLASERLFGQLSDQELNDYLIGFSDMDTYQANYTVNEINNGFYMETEGLVVSGKLNTVPNGEALKNTRMVLNAPDTLINLLYTYTDESGEFHFLLSDYYRDKELYFSVDPTSYEGPHEITPDDKFGLSMPFDLKPWRHLWERRDYIYKSQDILRIQKNFGIDLTDAPLIRFYRTARPPIIYYRPNITIRTDDYLPLDNLHEIARELVPIWRIRGSEEDYRTALICENTGNVLSGEPVFFLDGIIFHDLNQLIQLGSEDIDKIEIHNHHWVHGDMEFAGIIGLFTKTDAYQNIIDGSSTHASIYHESYRHHRIFNPPSYESTGQVNPGQPDMRQVLFWEPLVEISPHQQQTIEFYTGDLGGEYLITVEGLTSNGLPVYGTKTIQVK